MGARRRRRGALFPEPVLDRERLADDERSAITALLNLGASPPVAECHPYPLATDDTEQRMAGSLIHDVDTIEDGPLIGLGHPLATASLVASARRPLIPGALPRPAPRPAPSRAPARCPHLLRLRRGRLPPRASGRRAPWPPREWCPLAPARCRRSPPPSPRPTPPAPRP